MLQVLVNTSLESFNYRRSGMGYARVIQKKVKRIAIPLLYGKQCPTRAKYRLEKPSTYTTCHCIEFGQTL